MYLDEVEKYFIKKRNRALILSPKDWVLVEKWHDMGLPLKIVKKGIDIGFENFYINNDREKVLNSLKYCEPVILELWQEYKENMVGKTDEVKEDFNEEKYIQEKMVEFKNKIKESADLLKPENKLRIVEILRSLYKNLIEIEKEFNLNKINSSDVETELHFLQQDFIKKILKLMPSEEFSEINKNSVNKLKNYKNKMSKKAYEKTLIKINEKEIRKKYKLPDLTIW